MSLREDLREETQLIELRKALDRWIDRTGAIYKFETIRHLALSLRDAINHRLENSPARPRAPIKDPFIKMWPGDKP